MWYILPINLFILLNPCHVEVYAVVPRPPHVGKADTPLDTPTSLRKTCEGPSDLLRGSEIKEGLLHEVGGNYCSLRPVLRTLLLVGAPRGFQVRYSMNWMSCLSCGAHPFHRVPQKAVLRDVRKAPNPTRIKPHCGTKCPVYPSRRT